MKQADRRIGGWAVSAGGLALLILSAYPPIRLSAQVPDTTRAPIVTTGAIVVAPDTAHRIKPFNAFWRSLLLPGWGQAETGRPRSEEHTSGLQSHSDLVCRLLLEKKKK